LDVVQETVPLIQFDDYPMPSDILKQLDDTLLDSDQLIENFWAKDLSMSDLLYWEDGQWISDENIRSICEPLQRNISKLGIRDWIITTHHTSLFLSNQTNFSTSKIDRIRKKLSLEINPNRIFGIIFLNHHWQLIEIDVTRETVLFYCSLGWKPEMESFKMVYRFGMFANIDALNYSVVIGQCPKQPNGYDCGIMVLINLLYRIQRTEPQYDPKIAKRLRKELKLVQSKVVEDDLVYEHLIRQLDQSEANSGKRNTLRPPKIAKVVVCIQPILDLQNYDKLIQAESSKRSDNELNQMETLSNPACQELVSVLDLESFSDLLGNFNDDFEENISNVERGSNLDYFFGGKGQVERLSLENYSPKNFRKELILYQYDIDSFLWTGIIPPISCDVKVTQMPQRTSAIGHQSRVKRKVEFSRNGTKISVSDSIGNNPNFELARFGDFFHLHIFFPRLRRKSNELLNAGFWVDFLTENQFEEFVDDILAPTFYRIMPENSRKNYVQSYRSVSPKSRAANGQIRLISETVPASLVEKFFKQLHIALKDHELFGDYFFHIHAKGLKCSTTSTDCKKLVSEFKRRYSFIDWKKIEPLDTYLDFGMEIMYRTSNQGTTLLWKRDYVDTMVRKLGLKEVTIDNWGGTYDAAGMTGKKGQGDELLYVQYYHTQKIPFYLAKDPSIFKAHPVDIISNTSRLDNDLKLLKEMMADYDSVNFPARAEFRIRFLEAETPECIQKYLLLDYSNKCSFYCVPNRIIGYYYSECGRSIKNMSVHLSNMKLSSQLSVSDCAIISKFGHFIKRSLVHRPDPKDVTSFKKLDPSFKDNWKLFGRFFLKNLDCSNLSIEGSHKPESQFVARQFVVDSTRSKLGKAKSQIRPKAKDKKPERLPSSKISETDTAEDVFRKVVKSVMDVLPEIPKSKLPSRIRDGNDLEIFCSEKKFKHYCGDNATLVRSMNLDLWNRKLKYLFPTEANWIIQIRGEQGYNRLNYFDDFLHWYALSNETSILEDLKGRLVVLPNSEPKKLWTVRSGKASFSLKPTTKTKTRTKKLKKGLISSDVSETDIQSFQSGSDTNSTNSSIETDLE
jgi:hypothetical protein